MNNWDDELLRDSFRNDYPNSHQKGLQLESLSFEWDGSSIRLISARLAEPDEEKLYYAKKNDRL